MLSVRTEYIYTAAFQATSPGGVYILRYIHTLVKKKYWGYWLQVCTIRPLHVYRFSGSLRIRSRPVAAYASLSGTVATRAVTSFDSMHASVLCQLIPAFRCTESLSPALNSNADMQYD